MSAQHDRAQGTGQAQESWLSLLSPCGKGFQPPDKAQILNCLKQQFSPYTERMAQQTKGINFSPAFLQDVLAGSTEQPPAPSSVCRRVCSIALPLCLIQRRTDVCQFFFVQTY